MAHSKALGTDPVPKLLRRQAIPAAIGILTLSINGIIDNIFVGQQVGVLAIGAITVVLPITFLIASIGMAIGVGGASVISRALGTGDKEKALLTFGNQLTLVVGFSILFVLIGYLLQDGVLALFGGRGDILPYASTYFNILIPAIPPLALAMTFNNVIRAEGKPKVAMTVMVIPAIVNIVLDWLFIIHWDMGISGAAWATMLSYIASATYAVGYLFSGRMEMRVVLRYLRLDWGVVQEIGAIGSVTLARQGVVSLLAIVLNNALFSYGGEQSLSIWGIINRMMMFANFPVFGVTQGFLPIAGYNYGAGNWGRVRQVIRVAILYGTLIALGVFLVVMLCAPWIVSVFTTDAEIISKCTPALRWVFLATPTLTLQLIGAAYYQAIGKARPAMLLTMTKQGFFLVPLILILPVFMGILGVWLAFPIADSLTAVVNFVALRRAAAKLRSLPDEQDDLERHLVSD